MSVRSIFLFFSQGPAFFQRRALFMINSNALLAAEQVISQYQTSNYKQNRNDSRRDKKQDCHTCSETEQHQSAYSSHIIPQSIQAI